MRIFGLEIKRAEKQLTPVSGNSGWRRILEPFAGAWQMNVEEKQETVLCYPTLYACLNRISQDIGKLPFLLKSVDSNGIWNVDTTNTSYWPVLRKPNHFQTAQQFREYWLLSKLINGNTYVLKQRDNRGVVVKLFVLDPCRVIPMIASTGDVYYQVSYATDKNLLPENYPGEQIIIPASEIIHDRLNTFHHPLIGVPPLCAANWPAVKNLKILRDATTFFTNGANPGGILTAPAGMSKEDADAVKDYWNTNFQGDNAGKVAVIGADMKFTPFAFKAADSQLVEQMEYSDRQICQPFGVPPYKIGIGEIPAGLGLDAINQLYYSDALQSHIEAMENLLDEGLGITRPQGVELDLDPLLRMDQAKRADVVTKLVGGKIMLPNEARSQFGLSPTDGGDTLWGQNQDYPLGMLADRAEWDPQMQPTPAPAASAPQVDAEGEAAKEELKRLAPAAIAHRARATLIKRMAANAA